MRLYHTSNVEIRDPDIFKGRKNADFGQGFYLTPDRDFTYRWAGAESVVNEYDLDDRGLLIHVFERNEDWLKYIFQNRRLQDDLSVDVGIGPVANDTIFDTLGIIGSGLLNTAEAMRLLMIGPEYRQVAVKTMKAAGQLKWVRSERVTRLDAKLRKAEQEEYQAVFADTMHQILEERDK